jgi:hypothetical protein
MQDRKKNKGRSNQVKKNKKFTSSSYRPIDEDIDGAVDSCRWRSHNLAFGRTSMFSNGADWDS